MLDFGFAVFFSNSPPPTCPVPIQELISIGLNHIVNIDQEEKSNVVIFVGSLVGRGLATLSNIFIYFI